MALTRAYVQGEVLDILRRHVPEQTEVVVASTITGDLGLDSLAVMEVIADVEDRFHVTIPDDALPEMRTVGDVVVALEAYLAKRGDIA